MSEELTPVEQFDKFLAEQGLDAQDIQEKDFAKMFPNSYVDYVKGIQNKRILTYNFVDSLFPGPYYPFVRFIPEVHQCKTILDLKKYVWNRQHNKLS